MPVREARSEFSQVGSDRVFDRAPRERHECRDRLEFDQGVQLHGGSIVVHVTR
jgi:hypothetical protein